MFKICLKFQSNETGIYTEHIETASDIEWKNKKLERMLDYWVEIFDIDLPDNLDCEMKLEFLQCHVNEMNSCDGGLRTFSVDVLEF